MSTYVVLDVAIYDLERYQEFVSRINPAIESAGGRFLIRGGAHEVLEGDWEPGQLALIEFPSKAKAEGFYHSQLYKAWKSNREHWNWDVLLVAEGI